MNNTAKYDELLNGWEVKRQDALAAQQAATEQQRAHLAEIAEREAALQQRIDNFAALAEALPAMWDAAFNHPTEERNYG